MQEDQNENDIQNKSQRSRENAQLLSGLHTVNICVFLLMIVLIGALALFLPKPTVSQIEKRDLAKRPGFSLSSLFAGTLAEGLDLFYADTFPGREGMVVLASRLQELHGIRPDNVRIHEAAKEPPPPAKELPKQEHSPSLVPGTSTPNHPSIPAPSNGLTQGDSSDNGEKMGSVFLYKNMALPIFGANKTASARYAKVINDYHSQLGNQVQITNLVIPSSIAFYLPEKYKKLSGNEKENIDFIYSLLSPDIKTVDAFSELDKVKDQYLYFRSDHHWTVRGAYAAYLAFCKTQGFSPVPLEAMEHHQIDNFVGSLYGETQDSKLKETPDFVEYFIPPGEYTSTRFLRNAPYKPVASSLFADYATGGPNTYSVFLHGDFPLTHVKTKLHTGRKILLVKESFGNAFAPFLVSHYDEVFIVDQRYFQLGLADFIEKNAITDLLFMNNIFAANTDIRINEIERIRNQSYVPYVPKPLPPSPAPPAQPDPPPTNPEQQKEALPDAQEEQDEQKNQKENPKFVIKHPKDTNDPNE